MGQVLHGSATTTEAIRRAIQNSQESLRALSKRYGINQKTVAKWKKRTSVADLPTGPKEPKSTVLTLEEEAVIVAFRKHTLLPLDDCLYALQPTIPHLTRSSLHRCLQRHDISKLPDAEGDRPAKKKFKSYPIGYFHIDIAEVQTAEGKLYLFVAIDRTSKFAYAELHEKAGKMAAAQFLRNLVATVPYAIHTVLTDNGIQFTNQERHRYAFVHIFDRVCNEHGIEHRLTKIKHPWTTDVIDKSFLAGSAIFSRCAWMTAWRRVGSEVRALRRGLYRRASFAASVRTFFGPREFQPETKRVYAPSACSTQRRSSSRWLLIL
jgi:hypothetical protein